VVAEIGVMAGALPWLEASGRWSVPLPNALNAAFHYPSFLKALLVAYPFLWWRLYSGLLRQRSRRLGRSEAGGSDKRKRA